MKSNPPGPACDCPPVWAGIGTVLWHLVCYAGTQQEFDRSTMAAAFPALSKPMRRLLFIMSMHRWTSEEVPPPRLPFPSVKCFLYRSMGVTCRWCWSGGGVGRDTIKEGLWCRSVWRWVRGAGAPHGGAVVLLIGGVDHAVLHCV